MLPFPHLFHCFSGFYLFFLALESQVWIFYFLVNFIPLTLYTNSSWMVLSDIFSESSCLFSDRIKEQLVLDFSAVIFDQS
jgi:hypothetical protein